MALNAALLRSSFELVTQREPQLTRRFYEIFFEDYPEAAPLFSRNAARAQEQMLQRALVAVLDHIDDAAWLVETLGALGAKHVTYGVTDEMYGWVGGSLLKALAEVAGGDWTPELQSAWAEAYGAISGLMLRGAKSQVAA